MHSRIRGVCFFVLMLAGCGPVAPAGIAFPTPIRWHSPTVSPTRFFPTREVPLTPTLAPTPTPQTYTVRAGDTFGSIAAKFAVTVDALTAANPGVDPNVLSIGTVLIIPAKPVGTGTPQPTPTPVGLVLEPAHCYTQAGGGRWCLAMIGNPGPDAAAGVILRFSLYASTTADPSISKEVALPLSVLPAGARTIAAAYFSPEEAQSEILRLELISAIRSAESAGLLPLTIVKETSRPLSDGMELAVEFRIDADEVASANRLDAALVLLDSAGWPVGFRILRGEGEWPPGATHTLTLNAFSLGGSIADYEFILQARSVPPAE
ncbi:MAG: LysM peptidoglycan-binding domain-containing protein [Anaerolineales bacterium]|nr:LysM peptidoglycan-binding domain-containing protein [Anaerolineales bacterium]